MLLTEKDHTPDNVISHKTNLYLLAQNLQDVAAQLDQLFEEDKKLVIERAEKRIHVF